MQREYLEEGRFPLEKFEILKQLTKDPNDYKDIKSQPHVAIARRLNESKKFRLRQGDIVKYIICTVRVYILIIVKTNFRMELTTLQCNVDITLLKF